MLWGRRRRIGYANRRLSSSYGVDADEVVGEVFATLIPSSEHDRLVLAAQLVERRAAADDGDVVVLFCDLDRFKQVNDTHGHPVGDHVLRVSADRLRTCLRDQDVVARWGGDEFTALLHGSPADDAVTELVARICQRLAVPITDGGVTTSVGVTVGVSRAAVATADGTELLRTADEAMYARKPTR